MSSKFDVDSKKVKIAIVSSIIMIIIMFSINVLGKENKYEIGTGLEVQDLENTSSDNLEEIFEDKKDTYSSDSEKEIIFVDIIGAVNKPSLVEVKKEDRLQIAIDKAGGLTENAERTSINLAQKLVDGAQYIVPSKGEELIINYSEDTSQEDIIKGERSFENGKVNINLANKEELQNLTGIGEVLSQRIIEYREANNGFNSIEDIKNVKGIGDKKYEDIYSQICVN